MQLKITRCQFSSMRTEIETVSGQYTEHKGLEEEAEKKTMDVQYVLYGSKEIIT